MQGITKREKRENPCTKKKQKKRKKEKPKLKKNGISKRSALANAKAKGTTFSLKP